MSAPTANELIAALESVHPEAGPEFLSGFALGYLASAVVREAPELAETIVARAKARAAERAS